MKVVACPLSVVLCPLSFVRCQLSVVRCPLSGICASFYVVSVVAWELRS